MMIKSAARGMNFSADSLSIDEIKRVGPGNIFVGTPETFSRMRTATFLPNLADRDQRSAWAEASLFDFHKRAMDRARAILTEPNEGAIAKEVDVRVRAEFDGLVVGASVPPEGRSHSGGRRGRKPKRQTRLMSKKINPGRNMANISR